MRSCGVLMPVFSLPSPHGIGTLGEVAFRFIDFLAGAGQSWWQMLPLSPTGCGDSPYQSFSAFAGNPYLIDLDLLCGEGLLTPEELEGARFGSDPRAVDYAALFAGREKLLRRAAARIAPEDAGLAAFRERSGSWLPDYALFMAIKSERGMAPLADFPDELRLRSASALAEARARLREEICFYEICQYLFDRQLQRMRRYAAARGVGLIGDLPIYVSPDSSDLWAEPELFVCRPDGSLPEVAGCPPDAFSRTGQLWGNPLYHWPRHAQDGFAWWRRRMRHACGQFDRMRIDHFRGIDSYYAVPAGAATAEHGVWRDGPGMALIDALREEIPSLPFIAEDLGFLTDRVRALLRESGLPGMKVLQFAFDSREESDYLPHRYPRRSVVYTGTHDNTTAADWEKSAPAPDAALAREYLNLSPGGDFADALIRAALASVSELCIIPLADYLGLGAEARINTPGTLGGNWVWRALPEDFTPELRARMRRLAALYGRLPGARE